MSSRRSSRSAKPVVKFTDTAFVGSYAGKGLTMKAKAKEKEALRKAMTKPNGEIKRRGGSHKKKQTLNIDPADDTIYCVDSFEENVVVHAEDAVKVLTKKRKLSRKKAPRDKYDHTILMDMWSSHISDISAHKAKNSSTSGSSSNGIITGDANNDNVILLTGVPLWSDLWTQPDLKDSHSLPLDSALVSDPEEDSKESNTLSRRSRHAVMQSNRSRASECSLQEDLAMSWADPHVLVAPYAFGQVAPQVSEAAAQEQPFRVQVHPQVTFVSDLHAHMCDAEVIGLLAGKWDAKEKCLYIQSSFPCFSTVRIEDDGSTDVEMDPGAEIATREAIHRLDLQVVGWYHSHPCFRPDPSTTDIINQHSYQQLFRDAETNIEPFVGLIVSTFDPRRTSAESLHQWFHAVSFTNPLKAAKMADMYLPMRIEVCQLGVAAENCPIETRCSEESMRIMETKLLSIRVASEEREDNSEDKEDCVETVTLKDKEGVFEDAPPQKKSKLKEGKADEKLEGKRNDKENLVQMVVAPQAKGKRGRPRKIVPPQVGNIAQGALSVSHTTKDTVIPQPAVVSARGRSQKKRRFYDQDLTHPASPPSSAPLAHFSGSGGETYALQATVEGSSVSSFSGPGSETGLRAGAAASATTTGGSSRRSSRPPNSTTNRYGDYYHEEDEALKESLRRKIIKSKQKKSGKSIIATKSNTVPNTNVRYSINSNGSNCKNKTISTVSEATSSSNNSGSSMKMKGVSKDKEQQQAVVDIELDPPPLPPRYISLITGLQKDSSLASLARQLVCSAAPILQCSFLAIVTLGLYYSQHARRTTLTKPWRKKTKIDKIRSSIAVWLKYFGMCHSDEEKILDDVMEFLNLCWHDGNGNRR